MQKVSDPPITVCIKCSGPTSKLISPAGLMFKGSGWYITDYSSKGKPPKEEGKAEKGQEKVTEKKEEKPINPTK
jgi:predicted nucleic acid-binding Zn ribbon protein